MFSPVLVNGALRLTTGGLSDAATGYKSSVFLGAYQQIAFRRITQNGPVYFVKSDIAAGVYESVKRAAPPVRLGKAAFIGGRFVDELGLHSNLAYYCTETTGVIDYDGPAADAVRDLFNALFRLFPLTDADHLVRLFAALLTPFLMLHIDGPIPAILIAAHNPGDGKTLLAKVFALLADGDAVIVPWGNGPKFGEDLLAALDSDCRVVIVDNVRGELGGPGIEALITSRKLRGNLKYEGSRVFVNDKLIIVTGNNVIVTPDMARRVMRILVDRKGQPQPSDMPDLEALIPRERGRLLGMVKAILTAWDGTVLPVQGHKSFEQWAGTVGGILSACGAISEPLRLIDPDAIAADHDADTIRWGGLLDTWHSKLGEGAWSASEIVGACGTTMVKGAVNNFPGDPQRALGLALSSMNGRVLCGYRISREKQRIYTPGGEKDVNVYRLRKVLESVDNDCTLSVLSSRSLTREREEKKFQVPHACICQPDSTDNVQTNHEGDGGYPPSAFEE